MLSPTEEIKAKLDIIDVIQEYFPMKPSGANYKATCPFHQEKTPSFMVNRERQFYHCFGCSKSGDVFTFIQEMEGIEFPEALKILANKAGVKLPTYDPKITNLKTRLLEIQEVAMEWFHNQLLNSESGKRALIYLKEKRGLDDKTIKEWQLGYALDSWDALSRYLKSKNFTDEEILQGGLVVPKQNSREYYDRFRDRVMFPIEDYHGNVVGFTGRAMKEDESAKYVNTPQGLVYSKSEVIFGLYKAKQAIKERDKVVIVEGNMDVIASHKAGVKNVVAVSGTALTEEQIKILQRYTNNFVFAFDRDEAGVRAVERSINLAWVAEASVRVIAIDELMGKDPDEVIRKDADLWQRLVDKAVLAMDYFFELHLASYRRDDVESKKQVAKKLLNLIIKLGNPIEEDFYIKKLAERIEVSEISLREAIDKARAKKKTDSKLELKEEGSGIKSQVDKKMAMGQRLLAYMMIDGDYMEYISENLVLEHLPVELIELYKSLIVYYTKKDQSDDMVSFIEENYPDLRQNLNGIIILRDGELKGLSYNEAIREIKKYIKLFKDDYIKERLREMSREIELIEKRLVSLEGEEKENQETRLNELMAEHVRLSSELR